MHLRTVIGKLVSSLYMIYIYIFPVSSIHYHHHYHHHHYHHSGKINESEKIIEVVKEVVLAPIEGNSWMNICIYLCEYICICLCIYI
jgi:hypothetical protein